MKFYRTSRSEIQSPNDNVPITLHILKPDNNLRCRSLTNITDT